MEHVERITYLIYDARHQQVDQELQLLKQKVPATHPVHPLLKALNLYWMDAPMHLASPHYKEFIQLLHQTNRQAEAYLDKDIDKSVSIFAALTANSLLTRYHAETGDYMAALKQARPTYAYMKQGFELKDEYKEFYFPTGLYNYYRVKYPELHPVYKSFMWMFQDGNKTLGLQQMEYSVRNNVFTKAEAAVFLVHLYLYYENQPQKALQNIQILYKQFPNNRFIRLQLAESLLAARQYAAAAPHVAYLLQQSDAYYRAAGELFMGILQEKHYRNYQQALSLYNTALTTAAPLNYIADTYRSMAHAGIARYHEAQNQKEKAKAAWQEALKLAQYEYPVKQEAKAHLK
ncbi:hypothetical protein D770_08030 [Flammeovirgaceae bacterium 311]|nr:hypothetical protein D770_08030 [Flammeovirgaceae bacterium 311]